MSGAANFYEFAVSAPGGAPLALSQYRGRVVLVVNTASQCGFTPQYTALEQLYRQYQQQGLVVLGFPCNQFGGQEPGTDAEIATFCEKNHGVTFPLLHKIEVNGKHAEPLFTFLKTQAPGIFGSTAIKWNFTKFLIKKDGSVFRRYAPTTKPEQIEADIAHLLAL
jgi:glutathione peroxidase